MYCLFYARSMLAGWVRDSAEFAASFKVNFVPFFLAARATAAVLGGATVALVHAIARPLFGVSAGLLAALFMAVAFLHVRDSHYATTDVPMVFFVAAAMLAIVRVHCYRRAFDARLAGVLAGCAMGVKYNAVMLVLPMAIVEVVHAWRLRRGLAADAARDAPVPDGGLLRPDVPRGQSVSAARSRPGRCTICAACRRRRTWA